MGCGASKEPDAVLAQSPVEILVEIAKVNVEDEIIDDKVKFLESIKENDLAKVEECLRNNARLVNATTSDGWTGLHYCATKGFVDIAIYLIENNANLNCRKKDGNTPLHNAAMNNNVNMVHLLVKFGAKLDEFNAKEQTALQVAIQYNHSDSITQLEGYEKAAHEKFLPAVDHNIKSIKFDGAASSTNAITIESTVEAPTNDDTNTIIQDYDLLISPNDETSTITQINAGSDTTNWIEKYSVKYQRKYWKNTVNNTTCWNDPFKPTCSNPDYEVVYSASYSRYYFRHKTTKEKTWNDPSQSASSTKMDAKEMMNSVQDEKIEEEATLEQTVHSEIVDKNPSIQSNKSSGNENYVQRSHRKPPPPPQEIIDKVVTDVSTNDSEILSVAHRKPPPPPNTATIDPAPVLQAPLFEDTIDKAVTDDSVDAISTNTDDDDAAAIDPVIQTPLVEAIENVNTDTSIVCASTSENAGISSVSEQKSEHHPKRRPPTKTKFKVEDDVKDSKVSDTSVTVHSNEQNEILKSVANSVTDNTVLNKTMVPLSKKEQDKLIADQAMAMLRKKREEKEARKSEDC